MSFVVGELAAPITADLTQFNRGIGEAHRTGQNWATSMGQSMQRMGGQMQTLGRTATMAVTAPIVGISGAAMKMSMDFETSMQQIVGLVGVAQDQVDGWSQSLLELGPALGKTPQELAEGLYFVTSAGFRGAEAMEVLEISAKASAAGLGETKTIADLVTSAINAYGIENLDAAQAADILTASVREGKAEASELAGSLGQVLPIASELGVTFDEVGAATAAMTRTGTDAATASTQLRQILNSLLSPSQQAEETLNAMGTSASELRKQIREEGLLTVLQDLRQMTNEYGEDAMAKVFPNIRALAGVLDLMGENAEENIAIFDSVANSTDLMEQAFETAAETAQHQWNQAMAQAQASAIELGGAVQEAAIPVLQEAAGVISDLTEWFRNLDEEQQQNIIRWAGIAAAVGPVLIITGTLVKSIGTLLTMFGGLGKGIFAAKAAITGLGATMTATAATTQATTSTMAAIGVPLKGAASRFTTAGGAAVGFGAKLGALAAAAGPIVLVGGAVLGLGYLVKKTLDNWVWDQVDSEQVLASSLSRIRNNYAQTATSILLTESERRAEQIAEEIKMLEERNDLTEEENEKLQELYEEHKEEVLRTEKARHAAQIAAEEELNLAVEGATKEGHDEVLKVHDNYREELDRQAREAYQKEVSEAIEHYVDLGNVTEEGFRHLLEVAGENLKDIEIENQEHMNEIMKEHQNGLIEIGLIWDRELQEIVPITNRHMTDALQAASSMMKGEMEPAFNQGGNAVAYQFGVGFKAQENNNVNLAHDMGKNMGDSLGRGLIAAITAAINEANRRLAAFFGSIEAQDVGDLTPPLTTGYTWGGAYDSGGVVPGPIGSPQLALVHGGETILPTHKSGSYAAEHNFNIRFEGVPSHIDQRQLEGVLVEAVQDHRVIRAINEGLTYEEYRGVRK